MSARQRKLDFDDAVALSQKNIAVANELSEATNDVIRKEENLSRLINRFHSLMDEGNFQAAEEVTLEATRLAPESPEAAAANESAHTMNNYQLMVELRRLREFNFIGAMYQAEKSSVGFPGDPPLVFPDAETWIQKKALRKKYQDVRLAGNPIDETILNKLDEVIRADSPLGQAFDQVPFSDLMATIKKEYGFNVVLDQSAVDDSLQPDKEITFDATGIRFKNWLRLLLKAHNATFVVKDEVLLIISADSAKEAQFFVRNIYSVGDLVAPRQNFGGGGGFGGGQGGGGQGGGGFGGGGQGGGGFGGGGQGGGGAGIGGGFCIQDQPIALSDNKGALNLEKTKAIDVNQADWNLYFEKNSAVEPAAVRAAASKLMKANQPEKVVQMILAAIRNNQSQPWMYEGLVLAMQINNASDSDVERALMSAIDLSDDYGDAMIAADYMVKIGLAKRAVQVLMDVSYDRPGFVEPYVLGLKAAKKANDIEGIQWATLGILGQAWPTHQSVVKEAVLAAKGLQSRMQTENKLDELANYRQRLDEVLHRDAIIEVAFTGDADLDLLVEEPGGTICSRLSPKTVSGGVYMGDAYSKSPTANGETKEYYVLPQGFSGDYRLLVRRVWGNVTSNKATVTIIKHFGSENQVSETRQVPVSDKGTLVVFNLAEGRRKQLIDEASLATIPEQSFIQDKQFVAQQMNASQSPNAFSNYFQSRYGSGMGAQNGGDFFRNQAMLWGRRGAVGYQPIVTRIPSGTNLNVNHATTADRLYVFVSPSPNFQKVTDVFTFNFLAGAGNAQGVGGAGGAGGGGGLGGGQGGGLGGGGGGLGGGGGGGLF